MSGEIVNAMGTVPISSLMVLNMKDMSTWTKFMLLESLHYQMEGIMRVNLIMINSMGMELTK